MMGKIGEMYVEIGAKIDKLQRDMGRVRGVLKNTERPTSRLKSSFGSLARSMLAIGSAYLGMRGISKLASSFMSAATTSEGFRVRLTGLLGSVEEGNRLFQDMSKYAGEVPFRYEEIMEASTRLAGVMKGGVDEINEWMPLIGDLAAATGMTLNDVTGQVIRMYSAGAASADMFRERGVLAMLGFKAGVKYSVDETKEIMMNAWKDPESQFKGMTKNLATTWEGMTSMLADAWFQFRNAVMDSQVFRILKDGLQALLDQINKFKKEGKLDEWASGMARAVIRAFKVIAGGIEALVGGVIFMKGIFFSALQVITERVIRWQINLIKATEIIANAFPPIAKSLKGMYENLGNLITQSAAYSEAADEQYEKATDVVDAFEKLEMILNNAIAATSESTEKSEEHTKALGKQSQAIAGLGESAKLAWTVAIPKFRDMGRALDEIGWKAQSAAMEIRDALTEIAIPAARDFGGAFKEVTDGITTRVKEVKSNWAEASERMQDMWSRELGKMLSGAKSFKEGVAAIWTEMKQIFFDLVAQMIVRWISGLVQNMTSKTAEAATSISSSMKTIGQGISGIGTGLGSLIVTLAKAIAKAADIIASAAPQILIAAGVALAIYAGFKAIGSLFGGGKKGSSRDSWHFEHIWINTQDILNKLTSLEKWWDEVWRALLEKQHLQVVNLQKIAGNTKPLKNLISAQGGFHGTLARDTLFAAHKGEDVNISPINVNSNVNIQPIAVPYDEGFLIKFIQKATKKERMFIHPNAVRKT